MNRILMITPLIFLPGIVMAAPDIDAAVQDFCQCGIPPSAQCMAGLAKKYPDIDNSRELQDIVMRKAQDTCLSSSRTTDNSIKDMVGNENLDLSTLPPDTVAALKNINKVVSSTEDCSTATFKLDIPKNWQCRKQNNNAHDVTLYTNSNKLNVTVGLNQGMTSCSVIPICNSEEIELSGKFATTLYTNPMVGTYEYAGSLKNDGKYKLTITSTTKPTTEQLGDIEEILDSFERR